MKIKKFPFALFLAIASCYAMENPNQNLPFKEIRELSDMPEFAGKIVVFRKNSKELDDGLDFHLDSSPQDSFGYVTKNPNSNGAFVLNPFKRIPNCKSKNTQLYIIPEVQPFFILLRKPNQQELSELKVCVQLTSKAYPKFYCSTWGTRRKTDEHQGLIKKIEQQLASERNNNAQ